MTDTSHSAATASSRAVFVNTTLAIVLVAMIPPVVVAGMTAVLWAVNTLASLARGY